MLKKKIISMVLVLAMAAALIPAGTAVAGGVVSDPFGYLLFEEDFSTAERNGYIWTHDNATTATTSLNVTPSDGVVQLNNQFSSRRPIIKFDNVFDITGQKNVVTEVRIKYNMKTPRADGLVSAGKQIFRLQSAHQGVAYANVFAKGGYLAYGKGEQENSANVALVTDYPLKDGMWYNFTITLDNSARQMKVDVTGDDGTSYTGTFQPLAYNLPINTYTFICFGFSSELIMTVDHVKIYNDSMGVRSSSIAEGSVVRADTDLDITFAREIASGLDTITVTDAQQNAVPFTLTADPADAKKYKLEFTKGLEYATDYTVNVPDTVISVDSEKSKPYTLNFKTENKPVYYENAVILNAGAEADDLTGLTTVSYGVDFENNSGRAVNASVMALFYGADGKLKKAVYEDTSVAAGASSFTSAQPVDLTGLGVVSGKVYVFNQAKELGSVPVSDGAPDREFSADRTLYYVEVPEVTDGSGADITAIPEITLPGCTVTTRAADFGENNLTVLTDDVTGVKYRYIMKKRIADTGVEKLELKNTTDITVTGDFKTKLNMMILRPKTEKGDDYYSETEIAPASAEAAIYDVAAIPAGGTEFVYTLPADAMSGTYKIVIGGDGIAYENQFSDAEFYLSSTDLAECLTTLNGLQPGELYDYVKTNYKVMQADLSTFTESTDMAAYEAMLLDKNFADMPAAVAAFDTAAKVTELNSSFNQTTLEKYAADFGIDLTGDYAAVENKAAVLTIMSNEDKILTPADIQADFAKAVAVQLINEADPSEIVAAFESNAAVLGVSADIINAYNTFTENEKLEALDTIKNMSFTQSALPASSISSKIAEIAARKALAGAGGTTGTTGGGSVAIVPSGGAGGSAGSAGANASAGGGGSAVGGVAKDTVLPSQADKEPDSEKPELVPEADNTIFDDLAGYDWAEEAILYFYEQGVISGKGNKKYDPSGDVTREEFVKIAILAANILSDDVSAGSFADVPDDAWYSEYIKTAVAEGIINGISETEFGVGKLITRQDMAVVLSKLAEAAGKTITKVRDLSLADFDAVAEYAQPSVQALFEGGLINGVGDDMYDPNGTVTRAMAARAIYNLVCDW